MTIPHAHTAMIQNRVVPLVGIALLLFVTPPVAAFQVLSPSTTPQSNDDLVASELNNLDTDPVDPSTALLNTLNNLIPGEISEMGIEDQLLEITNLFLGGKVQEVVDSLSALKDEHPRLPPPQLLVAGMLFTAGNSQQGTRWLEQAAVDSPRYPAIYTGFARIAITQNRITDADALLEKAQRLIADGSWDDASKQHFETEYLDGLTDVRIRRNQLDDAKATLLKLEQLVPANSKVPLRLAQVEFDLGNYESCLDYLQRTKVIEPNLRAPEVIIADWFFQKRKLDESEEWIRKAARIYPDDPNVQLDFGKWLLKTENLREALEVTNRAVELGADKFVASFLKGQVAFARRSYDVAEMHFEELNRLRPGDANAANMLALSLIESPSREKKSRALELATMNQRLYSNSPTTLATLGWIQYRLGRLAEAENAFQQLTTTQNLEPASAYFVAVFLHESGNIEPAIGLLRAALDKESYFMFRAAAEDLLAQLEEQAAQSGSETGEDKADKAADSDDGK